MNQAVPNMTDNAMYAISDEQRAESQKRLVACEISGILKDDPNDADLAIATVVALSIRDVSQSLWDKTSKCSTEGVEAGRMPGLGTTAQDWPDGYFECRWPRGVHRRASDCR